MLKSSKTWPSILTMAVVQLKFDQKGKYSYSTIANINQLHKHQIIESHIPLPNGRSGLDDGKQDATCQHNGDHKKDLITRKNVKSRSVTAASRPSANGRPHNGFISVNGGVSKCATSPGHNAKVCLCDLGFRDRKRSESIKVDNWDYIYKEKPFRSNLNLANECNATPK